VPEGRQTSYTHADIDRIRIQPRTRACPRFLARAQSSGTRASKYVLFLLVMVSSLCVLSSLLNRAVDEGQGRDDGDMVNLERCFGQARVKEGSS
jgi:hypothetical protein